MRAKELLSEQMKVCLEHTLPENFYYLWGNWCRRTAEQSPETLHREILQLSDKINYVDLNYFRIPG